MTDGEGGQGGGHTVVAMPLVGGGERNEEGGSGGGSPTLVFSSSTLRKPVLGGGPFSVTMAQSRSSRHEEDASYPPPDFEAHTAAPRRQWVPSGGSGRSALASANVHAQASAWHVEYKRSEREAIAFPSALTGGEVGGVGSTASAAAIALATARSFAHSDVPPPIPILPPQPQPLDHVHLDATGASSSVGGQPRVAVAVAVPLNPQRVPLAAASRAAVHLARGAAVVQHAAEDSVAAAATHSAVSPPRAGLPSASASTSSSSVDFFLGGARSSNWDEELNSRRRRVIPPWETLVDAGVGGAIPVQHEQQGQARQVAQEAAVTPLRGRSGGSALTARELASSFTPDVATATMRSTVAFRGGGVGNGTATWRGLRIAEPSALSSSGSFSASRSPAQWRGGRSGGASAPPQRNIAAIMAEIEGAVSALRATMRD